MTRRTKKDAPRLLVPIPEDRLTVRQKSFRTANRGSRLPMFKMLREPSHLEEFDFKNDNAVAMAIWQKNGTLICISQHAHFQYAERNVRFALHVPFRLNCAIYGKRDAAIAETLTFFCSLKHPEGIHSCLEFGEYGYNCGRRFDFCSSLKPEQLAQIMDANPTRKLELQTGTWSAEQSVVLATRPYRLDLSLAQDPWSTRMGAGLASFQDGGTAFVNALEEHLSHFGSLSIDFDKNEQPLSRSNFRRLLDLEVSDTLSCFIKDKECALLPFATEVTTLDYKVDAKYIQPRDFWGLDIVTKDLRFKMCFDDNDTERLSSLLISFLNQVAELGHFQKLSLSIEYYGQWDVEDKDEIDCEDVAHIVEALSSAILANPNLAHLDLSDNPWLLDWNPHLEDIFDAIDGHPAMRTFILKKFPTDEDESDDEESESENWIDYESERSYEFDYSLLEDLLSRNRNLIVLDRLGKRFSNGPYIDSLYSRNYLYRFGRGSATLVTEPASMRPLLVTTALLKSASKNFQYSSLLLSDHADVLCELLEDLNEEEEPAVARSVLEAAVMPDPIPSESNRADPSKRKASIQPSHAAKKAARK